MWHIANFPLMTYHDSSGSGRKGSGQNKPWMIREHIQGGLKETRIEVWSLIPPWPFLHVLTQLLAMQAFPLISAVVFQHEGL